MCVSILIERHFNKIYFWHSLRDERMLTPKIPHIYILKKYTCKQKRTFDGDRTHDHKIKSLALYHLSYEGYVSVCWSKKCVHRESNPGHLLGRQIFYHWTIDACIRLIYSSWDDQNYSDSSPTKIHPPRIELGTSRVLGERHNQLDQGCLLGNFLWDTIESENKNIQTNYYKLVAMQKYILRGLNSGPLACEASVITN